MLRLAAAACLVASAHGFGAAPSATSRSWRARSAWAPAPASPYRRASAAVALFSTEEDTVEKETPKQPWKQGERKRIASNDNFLRGHGWAKDVKKKVEAEMREQFDSDLVQDLKTSNFVLEREGVKVYLAKEFGFCWGVERSIDLAYSAVESLGDEPGRQLHITNELIHNPAVNDALHDKNVNFVQKDPTNAEFGKDFSNINKGDVVMLPAFGATLEEMQHFEDEGVTIVDTTCPWVAKVWNAVHQHQLKGLTSVVHGKYAHEETAATTSFCESYICVKDMDEAMYLADYMVNGGDKEAFMKKFSKAVSKGFDPDRDLKKVGLANQTTMYKKETKAIGQLLQRTMMTKFGPENLNEHYLEFDTICDATQVRQDAVSELCDTHDEIGLDFIVVVGGWDSSNTAHLLEIPQMRGVPSYHVNEPGCVGADNSITHRKVNGDVETTAGLLSLDNLENLKIGVTSGASTPDSVVQDTMSRIFLLKAGLLAAQENQAAGAVVDAPAAPVAAAAAVEEAPSRERRNRALERLRNRQ